MASISFVVQKTPAPPELILDYDSEISFNNTTEDFPSKEASPDQTDPADAIQNGSILVGWVEYVAAGESEDSFYNLKNIDLIGDDNFSIQATNASTQVATDDIKVAKLIGYNKVAVAYVDNFNDGDFNSRWRLQVVNSANGAPISGPITKTISSPGAYDVPTTLVLPLSGGRIVWAYKEYGETPGTLFDIYDDTLSSLYTYRLIDDTDACGLKGVVLTGGDFVIVNTTQTGDSGIGTGVEINIYDGSDGSGVFNTNEAYNPLETGLSVVATDDGGFVVCIAGLVGIAGEGQENKDLPGRIRLRKYDSTGDYETQVVLDFPETDPGGGAAWGSICNCQMFKLDSGDLAVVGFNYGTKKLFSYVINQSLTTVQQSLTLLNKTISEITDLSYTNTSVAKFSDGKYGLVKKRPGASGIRVYVDVLVGGAST
jgi:hypothetical protein